jgi:HPr kinase/phosphorylase
MSLVPCKTKSVRLFSDPVHRRGPARVEKQNNNKLSVSLHGVALEMGGKGFLITGASGIGKTTAALKAMMPGHFWIADDLAVIGKNQAGALIITGHQKIRKYLHTEQTGIIEVIRILPASQIKNKTRLQAVIDVVRTDTDAVTSELHEKEILETKLPCLRISIPNSSYFNPNLLKKAASQFQEVG